MSFDRWSLPILAFTLLVSGLMVYPETFRQLSDAKSFMREYLLMLLPTLLAFWLGWKAEVTKSRDIPPHYLLILAFALALLPPALHMSYGNHPAWRIDIDGLIVRLDAGLVSSMAFLGWVASLRSRAKDYEFSNTWMSEDFSVLVLFALWFWVVGSADGYFLKAGFLVLPVAVISLRGTRWFATTLGGALGLVCFKLLEIILSPYRRWIVVRKFFSYDDPFGRPTVVREIQRIYEASSLLGGNTNIHIPRASDQYILISLLEHHGWLGLGLVLLAVVIFFTVSLQRLRNQPESWRKVFSISLWGFLAIGFTLNLFAVSTLTTRPGIPIPFFAHNFAITAMAAFITGVSMRGTYKTSRRRWPRLSVIECNMNTDKAGHFIAYRGISLK